MSGYLAIDIGTEGARSALYGADGAILGEGSAPYATTFPRPGWAEQDPEQWWASAVAAARAALDSAGHPEIRAICVATTASSVVFCDAEGRPERPAILWMDARAAAESARTAASSHPSLAFSGGSDSSEWLVPKVMWVSTHEPDVYTRSVRIVEAVDYLTFRLTGRWVGSRMNATCKWNVDPRAEGVPTDLYDELGVADLGDKLPPSILKVGAVAGVVSPAAAAKLGIDGAPTVAVGGIDAHLSLVALGAESARPVSIVAGTSNAFIAELDEPVFSPAIWGPYPWALTEGRWLIEGGQAAAGASLTWLAERMFGFERTRVQALIEDAAKLAAGAHGLLVLDDFMGNRTPRRDPLLRGGVLGATLATTPTELYRATVESVAFGTRAVLDSFEDVGVDTGEIFLSGGIRHNSLWLQTTADVLARPVRVVHGDNLTLRACASLAARSVGADIDARAIQTAVLARTRVVDPNQTSARVLAERFPIYLEAVAATRTVMHALARGAATTQVTEAVRV